MLVTTTIPAPPTKTFKPLDSNIIVDHFRKTDPMRDFDLKLMEDHGVDIYSQGNRQTMIFQIVAQNTFDVTFSCNYSKHGIDAFGKIGETEIKSYRCKPINAENPASFSFHANGPLHFDSYSFVVWNGRTVVRFYNVTDPRKTKVIHSHLDEERNKWMSHGGNKKNDVIRLPEAVIENLFTNDQLYSVSAPDFSRPDLGMSNPLPIMGNIRDYDSGAIRYFSDY